MSLKDKCALVGVGYSEQGKVLGRTGRSLCLEATRNAIEDTGLSPVDIDGVLVQPAVSDPLVSSYDVAYRLGIQPSFVADEEQWAGPGATAIAILQHAAMAVDAGLCRYALCAIGDSMLSSGALAGASARRYDLWYDNVAAACGFLGPSCGYAMAARRHMHEYGTTSRQLGAIAVAFRKHAMQNPRAQMRQPLTIEEHQSSRWIMEPFHLYDCCLVSDAGRALIVTSAERAQSLKHPPVYIIGMGQAHFAADLLTRPSLCETPAKRSGEMAYRMAGVTPQDIDVALLYDCFTYTVLAQLEDYGFCAKGEGGPFAEGGNLELGGKLPTNTSGGLLSEVFLQGWVAASEAVQQLRGDCGPRQVKDAEIALVSNNGGYALTAMDSHTTLILRR